MANKTINDFPESTSPSGEWFVLVDDGTGCYKKVKLKNLPCTCGLTTTSTTSTASPISTTTTSTTAGGGSTTTSTTTTSSGGSTTSTSTTSSGSTTSSTTSSTSTSTTSSSTSSSTSSTSTTAIPPPAYNYYTLTPCVGGGGTDYRSTSSYALGSVYTFLPNGPGDPPRACYTITSITAPINSNDLPTIYGPVAGGCESIYCQQP